MQAGILTIVLAYRKREIFYGRNIDIRLMYLSYTSTLVTFFNLEGLKLEMQYE